jgi:hypothetical protein
MTATRRELLVGAIPAMSAASDRDHLRALPGLEQLLAFAYGRAGASAGQGSRTSALAATFAAQERTHASLVATAGGEPVPAPPADIAAADRTLEKLGVSGRLAVVHSEREHVKLLIELERAAERSYYAAISKVQDPRLSRLLSQILANEAQHESALRALLDPRDPRKFVRTSFVDGTH